MSQNIKKKEYIYITKYMAKVSNKTNIKKY